MYRLNLKPGRHLPPDQVEVNLASQLQISNLSIVREERINRKVPTPGGVTAVPAKFDSKLMVLDKSKGTSSTTTEPVTRENAFPPVSRPVSTGAIPKNPGRDTFKARDIREAPLSRASRKVDSG